MIDFYQVTGSSSFAVRCALEEIGAPYRAIDIAPADRGDPPEFGALNPWRRVPTLRDGEAAVYEIGACLLYLAERFPEAGLQPTVGDPDRGAYLRWLVWLSDSFRPLWERITAPRYFTTDADAGGVYRKGLDELARTGEILEAQLAGHSWCLGDRYSVADVYLYMLVGWQHYLPEPRVGGDAVQAHYARVGSRPAIARTRDLDGLDEFLQRRHPDL